MIKYLNRMLCGHVFTWSERRQRDVCARCGQKGRAGSAYAMLLRRELERRGDITLIQSQFIGVSGQVCGTTYEVTGPRPGQFCSLAEARRIFDRVSRRQSRELA